jgi:hypothetical protein
LRHRSLTILVAACLLTLMSACSFGGAPDVDSAATFERFPVYWLGEEFEGRELTHVQAEDWSPAVLLVYGECTPSGGLEPSCVPPVQIQIFPLCYHLDAVAYPLDARSPQTIRGAPVCTQDGAPVLLTRRTQVKVYRGEGTDVRIGRRALAALRSLNSVAPVIGPSGPIPPPPHGVLEGERPCRK